MSRSKLRIDLWCWNIRNSKLYLELLWRSELTVQCTNAFNTILPTPRSTKYSFFSLQLQFLSLFHRTFQCCNVITWPKQTIPLRLATIQSCNFTSPPITSCILGQNVLTTPLLNTLNVWPSHTTRDQHCNINKWQVKLNITFLYHCLQTDRQTDRKIKVTFHINWIT